MRKHEIENETLKFLASNSKSTAHTHDTVGGHR